MSILNQVLAEMDFNFFSSGKHGMNIEGMRKALGNDHIVFLDVRSEKETEYAAFPFATGWAWSTGLRLEDVTLTFFEGFEIQG